MPTKAVDGTNIQTTRPLALAFNGSAGASAATGALVAGSYYLVASADCFIAVNANPTAAAFVATNQPAANAATAGEGYVVAGTYYPLDLEAASLKIAALAVGTAAGTLYIVGPIGRSKNP